MLRGLNYLLLFETRMLLLDSQTSKEAADAGHYEGRGSELVIRRRDAVLPLCQAGISAQHLKQGNWS